MATKTEKAELLEAYVPHAVFDEQTGMHLLINPGDRWREDSVPCMLNPGFFHSLDVAANEKPHWRALVRPGTQTDPVPPSPSGYRQRPRGLHTGA
jgi:hypothetical protein